MVSQNRRERETVGTQSVVLGPAPSTSSRSLSEMQSLRLSGGHTESEAAF